MSKKTVKPESNGEVKKPERLASLFSTSRDLSLKLNGKTNQRSQTNKKVFTPNLNAARKKNVDSKPENEGQKRETKGDRGKNQRGRGGKNNLNKRTSNLVQTMGVFSEGSAALISRKSDQYASSSRDNSSAYTEALQKPKIVKRDQKFDKADLDADQKTLSDLLGDDDDNLYFDDEDSKISNLSDDLLPIKISDPNKRRLTGLNSKKLETDLKIKMEPKDYDDVEIGTQDSSNIFPNGITIKTEPGELKTETFSRMDQLFDASPDRFMLFQLPDTLPGRAPDSEESSEKPAQSKTQNPNLCSLEHFQEGLIGKLVRYKSGKTKLVLGEMAYDIDLGLMPDFQQNAVTINANRDERSANMYSLGEIHSKYNVTPDWNHLFYKMSS